MLFFFFQAEDGIRDLVRSRGLGDVYKRQIESYLATRTPDDPIHSAVALGADHFAVIDPQAPAYLLVLAEIEELTLATH